MSHHKHLLPVSGILCIYRALAPHQCSFLMCAVDDKTHKYSKLLIFNLLILKLVLGLVNQSTRHYYQSVLTPQYTKYCS